MPGAATQIFTHEFDTALLRLPKDAASLVMAKIAEMGVRMESFPHYRMTGRNEFRLRVGDYRVIYSFNLEKNELNLITLGHRREIYR